ncbi:hypothetical protein [Psychromicrobium lacuslunae]|uniref:Tachylectin 2 domain-containing protein n=1 Tax=Psychromicrobium lacuslunae TaxID=1618207 RepID=A0A0D4BVA3_9MICC|nr:hypothetical protein [Psychromicrobium lacuslunae]AJT40367.1 hypothetical protein UM93_00195 [Psychromicrobium lacuslunae]
MKMIVRRTGATLATAALACGLMSIASNSLATTADSSAIGIPGTNTCSAGLLGVNAKQQIINYFYSSTNGTGSLSSSIQNNASLGFTPRTLVHKRTTGPDPSPNWLGTSGSDYYANASDGSLYVIGLNNDNTITKKKVNGTWGSIRKMTTTLGISGTADAIAYALTDQGGLNRYTLPAKPENMTGTTVVATSGWQNVNTLSYYYSKKLADGDIGDVLLATTKAGQLIEYTLPRKTPGKWSSVVVRSTSWQNITTLSRGGCLSGPLTPWIGMLGSGDAYLYTDKNYATPVSGDIAGLGHLATGWPTNSYPN